MNSLSWLIYLADVVGGMGLVAGISVVVLGVLAAGAAVGIAASADIRDGAGVASCWSFLKKTLCLLLPTAIISVAIPNPNTIYAIAASEMGEEIVKSETAGKAMKALDAWLDRQIDGKSAQTEVSQ